MPPKVFARKFRKVDCSMVSGSTSSNALRRVERSLMAGIRWTLFSRAPSAREVLERRHGGKLRNSLDYVELRYLRGGEGA